MSEKVKREKRTKRTNEERNERFIPFTILFLLLTFFHCVHLQVPVSSVRALPHLLFLGSLGERSEWTKWKNEEKPKWNKGETVSGGRQANRTRNNSWIIGLVTHSSSFHSCVSLPSPLPIVQLWVFASLTSQLNKGRRGKRSEPLDLNPARPYHLVRFLLFDWSWCDWVLAVNGPGSQGTIGFSRSFLFPSPTIHIPHLLFVRVVWMSGEEEGKTTTSIQRPGSNGPPRSFIWLHSSIRTQPGFTSVTQRIACPYLSIITFV